MQIEQSNAILRELKLSIEYLARIHIMSESFQDEWFNSPSSETLLDTFVRPIIPEFTFCGILFKFLNYSASQIKQKSWWDYVDNHAFGDSRPPSERREVKEGSGAGGNGESSSQGSIPADQPRKVDLIESLRKGGRDEFLNFIGQFRDKQPLKQLARQGQSMSSSTFISKIPEARVRVIEDLTGDSLEEQLEFSDGCGFVSPEVMAQVADIFEFEHVSAIQMRYGGFKGVLTVHPGLGDGGEAGQVERPLILFRKSMRKFLGKLDELSVIRCATFSPAFLNRQVITLLSYLGVPDQLFLDRNAAAMQKLDIGRTLDKLQRYVMQLTGN